jgi:hypothetical protein
LSWILAWLSVSAIGNIEYPHAEPHSALVTLCWVAGLRLAAEQVPRQRVCSHCVRAFCWYPSQRLEGASVYVTNVSIYLMNLSIEVTFLSICLMYLSNVPIYCSYLSVYLSHVSI